MTKFYLLISTFFIGLVSQGLYASNNNPPLDFHAAACELGEMHIEKTDCNAEKQFYVYINFDHANTSECFKLTGNGKNYGTFNYSALPIKIGPLKGDCATEYEFVARDCHNELCATDKLLGKVCCENQGECELYDFKYEKTKCDAEGNFYVYIKFSYKNTSDCFELTGNGHNYGTYKYSQLPLKIGPLKGNCETEYEFAAIDCHNEHCFIEKVIGKVCCENNSDCLLSDLTLEKTACNDDKKFFVVVNFKYKNTSDCFTLTGGGKNYGTFKYSDLPLKVGPLAGDCQTFYEFVARDCHNEKCSIAKELGKVCCEDSTACKLGELELKRSDCNEEKEFFVTINFFHKNTSDCFTVTGNGHNYGTFKYSDLPIKIGPLKGNCETEYEFIIRDCHNEKCVLEKVLGKVCCDENGECALDDLRYEKSKCNAEGEFFLYLNFKYKNTSDCFKVHGNGHDYGSFKYADLPIKIGPLKGNCETEYEFVIEDCEKEHCSLVLELGKVCCEEEGECELWELRTEQTDCNDDHKFFVYFNFNYKNTSDCFKIIGNGKNYGSFKYANLPVKIGPLAGDCHTEYEFVIVDCENEHCRLEKTIGVVCCETEEICKIVELDVDPLECTGQGQYSLKLNFNHQGTTGNFDVFDRTGKIGTYPYSALPITIADFKKSAGSYDLLKVCDHEKEDCCKSTEFKALNCFGSKKDGFNLRDLRTFSSIDKLGLWSEFAFPEHINIEVSDLSGRKLELKITESSSHEKIYSAGHLNNGIYLIKVSDGSEYIHLKWFKF